MMNAKENKTIVIQWPRFGPYHLARLDAVGRFFQARGWHVVGLECAGTDGTYRWTVQTGNTHFERLTLFPEMRYDRLHAKRLANAVIAALDRVDPRIVVVAGWSYCDSLAALRWARQNRRMAICMSESKADDAVRRVGREVLKRYIVRAFDAALVGGTPHADYVAALGLPRDRVVTGYDVVDNDWFARGADAARAAADERRREYGLPDRYFYANARLIPRKNIARLLEAYADYAHRASRPWSLVITGDGPCRHDLLRLCTDLDLPMGLSPRMVSMDPGASCRIDPESVHDVSDGKGSRRPAVYWPGFVQYNDLPAYYGLASAFVMPSVQDQWGLVVNEAMAAGLPVLVSRTAGCRYDLVRDGRNGWLFDPLSRDAMTETLTRMAASDDTQRLAMGGRSRKSIASWGPNRFADSLWRALHLAAKPRLPMTMAERMAFHLAVLSRRWTEGGLRP